MPRRSLVPLLLVGVLALPASAEATVADPCGDTDPFLLVETVGTRVVEATDGPRAASFDVRSARVSDVRDGGVVTGVEVRLELCGEVPQPELQGSSWSVGWELPPVPGARSCAGGVALRDLLVGTQVVRQALVEEQCTRPGGLLGQEGVTSAQEYAVPLVDWSVDGAVITWSVRRSDELGPAADRFAPGTVLAGVSARTRDGRTVTTTEGSGPVSFRLTGPGAEDAAGPGGDHVVG